MFNRGDKVIFQGGAFVFHGTSTKTGHYLVHHEMPKRPEYEAYYFCTQHGQAYYRAPKDEVEVFIYNNKSASTLLDKEW